MAIFTAAIAAANGITAPKCDTVLIGTLDCAMYPYELHGTINHPPCSRQTDKSEAEGTGLRAHVLLGLAQWTMVHMSVWDMIAAHLAASFQSKANSHCCRAA